MTSDRELRAVNADADFATPEERFDAWLAEQEAKDGPLRTGRRWKGLTRRNVVPLAISLAIWSLFGWAAYRTVFGW